MGQPRTISDERVPLVELIDDTRGDYLDRITFERCEILGPAVVVPMVAEMYDPGENNGYPNGVNTVVQF